MIRLPDIPGLQGSPINAPELRAGAVAAPAVALEGFAKQMGEVSAYFHDSAVQVQKIQNAKALADMENQMKMGLSQLEAELEFDQDPESRLSKTQAYASNIQGMAGDGSLPPAVRDQIGSFASDMGTRAVSHEVVQGAKMMKRNFLTALDSQVKEAITSGDVAAAETAINRGVESGALSPEQGQAALKEVQTTVTVNNVYTALDDNPKAVLAQAEEGSIAGVSAYQQKRIAGVTVDDVYLGNGASELIAVSMNALLNAGDAFFAF